MDSRTKELSTCYVVVSSMSDLRLGGKNAWAASCRRPYDVVVRSSAETCRVLEA